MKPIFKFFVLLPVIAGCATSSQMAVDTEVRRLCAIDGGIRVYETVKLSADKFNQWGQVNFYRPTQGENALGPSYLLKHERRLLIKSQSEPSHELTMVREHFTVVRKADKKVLGETVLYGRGGGGYFGAMASIQL
ncbi:hypothetical protein B9N43_04890 [Denitratisoma sp. DHT3]|uniref:hypothetical protein n=1 Tax=Denitratisoma sp. DHT3 TaxID=1981880 RepID=UPI001198AA9F|nr:hypothetical protein [Denitratisoma sp. DHT3]QDX80639.1 hypothetical protein B9N43_04890 [Denitratisoma sp. DHT3]